MYGLLLLVAAGVASHAFYFNRGEHHLWAEFYIKVTVLGFCGTVAALVKLGGDPFASAVASAFLAWTSYLFGIYSSLVVYRVWLSPLNKFPGPWQAKIFSLWVSTQLTKFDGYLYFEELHKKYGKFVRIGSNDLSISDADLHDVAFGQTTLFQKADWYDISVPFTSMHTTRDKALHDRRRRVWAPAFSDRALREYEPKVRAFNDKLVERVREHANGPINMSRWFNLYAFDVMGQLAFGKDYSMLDSGERHWALELLVKSMEAAPPRMPSWLMRVLKTIPFALEGLKRFLRFCSGEIEWRVKNKNLDADITGWLLKAYKDFERPADDPMFTADIRLIIVAGSDTTAATLAFLFYHLAKQPEEMKKLREELKPLTSKDNWSDFDIRHAPHLNGAINEALRLHPPVPSGVSRKVPKAGVQVGDVFVPGETTFWMPQYVIGRDEENYENALEFVPERWYSKPEMIKHKNAFAPFSLGSEGCIGKNLAYLEIRTLTTQLLLSFDVALAPGEDGTKLLYESKDHFTVGCGSLDLVFTPLAA